MTTRFSSRIKRRNAAAMAILPLAGLMGLAIATTAAGSRAIVQGSQAVADFMGRSPGERGIIDSIKGRQQHALAKTAGAGDPFADKKPTERALGKIFDLPLDQGAGGPSGINPLAAPQTLGDSVPAAAPLQNLASIPGLNGGPLPVNPPSGGGSSGVPGGSGGSPGSGGTPGAGGDPGVGGNPAPPIGGGTVTVPPVVVPGAAGAVPEPATWLTMVIGFGLVGAGLRRRKAIKQAMAA